MAKGRTFTTIPSRVIGDASLSALDIRCIGVIAMHDGMSLYPKKDGEIRGGPGCYARSATLAAALGVDVTNFSRSLSKLIKKGYILREQQQNDKRRFTLRVIPQDTCHYGQPSGDASSPDFVDADDNDQSEMVDDQANQTGKVVVSDERENGSFSKDTAEHYIPLNGELNSVKTDEINSVETAHLSGAECGNVSNELAFKVEHTGSRLSQKECAEAQALQTGSILKAMPANFSSLPVEAQLQRIELALKALGNKRVESRESELLSNYLFGVSDDFISDQRIHQWANRLLEQFEWGAAA